MYWCNVCKITSKCNDFNCQLVNPAFQVCCFFFIWAMQLVQLCYNTAFKTLHIVLLGCGFVVYHAKVIRMVEPPRDHFKLLLPVIRCHLIILIVQICVWWENLDGRHKRLKHTHWVDVYFTQVLMCKIYLECTRRCRDVAKIILLRS